MLPAPAMTIRSSTIARVRTAKPVDKSGARPERDGDDPVLAIVAELPGGGAMALAVS
jgi:hypothetical protein